MSRRLDKVGFGIGGLALAAILITGCAGIFGLSDYTFDEATLDASLEAAAIDSSMNAPDARDGASHVDSGPPAPSCTDHLTNGKETDVDCGGTCATKCAAKKVCLLSADCQTGLACVDQLCLSPSSNDGVQDGTETDIDCGGPSAPVCGTGKVCVMAARDCASKVCTGGVCIAPKPTDGIQNGAETDIDCGGGTAPVCIDNKHCVDGFRDCVSRVCTNLLCHAPTATDGYKNGNETDVDCGGGGGTPACIVGKACVTGSGARDCVSGVCTGSLCQAAAPSDGVKNGTETDIDCGGGAAPACADNKMCALGTRDCTSKVCTGNVCKAPTTSDGVKNGTETDVDCGGGGGNPACIDGKACAVSARDCTSLVCGAAGSCQVPSSTDGVKNGTETDLDCGGGGGNPACVDGKLCTTGPRDCTSKVCLGGACQVPTHTDGAANGTETDIDCGGGNGANPCANGKLCVQSARDCTSLVCNATCQIPATNDGVQNGTETDVDCGGGGGNPKCADGLKCALGPRDCTSKVCDGVTCQIPTSTDGVKNGTETDIDCGGGGANPTCANGLACVDGVRDCMSMSCVGAACVP